MFNSKFSNRIISSIINKFLSKKIKKDIKLSLNDININISDSEIDFSIKGSIPKENFSDIVDLLLKK